MRRPGLLAAAPTAIVLLAAGIAGCGGSGSGDGDAASLVPSSSLVFVQGDIGPEGDKKAALETMLRKVLRRDPGPVIQRELDKSFRSDRLTYGEDVEPWLGETAAVAVVDARPAGPTNAALLIATTDEDAAAEALGKSARNAGTATSTVREREYNGVEYLSDGREGYAVVDGFAVLGTDRAVRSIIDTAESGPAASLSESGSYTSAMRKLGTDGDELVGTAYVDTPRFATLLRQSAAGAGGAAFLRSLDAYTRAPLAAGLEVRGDAAVLEVAGPAPTGGAASDGAAADLVAQLPQNSFFATAAPAVGAMLRQSLAQFGPSAAALADQVRRETGLDLERDLLGPIGSVSVYAAGGSVLDLSAAVEIETSDPAASARAVTALEKLVRAQARQQGVQIRPLGGGQTGFTIVTPALPLPIQVAVGDDRVTIGIGALDRSSAGAFADSEAYDRATNTLGDGVRPTFYVDLERVFGLLGATVAANDPSFARAKPYLDAFAFVAAGSRREGDTQLQRFAVGLR